MTTEQREDGCRCPVGLPPGAVEELIALSLAVVGKSPCPVHTDVPDGEV